MEVTLLTIITAALILYTTAATGMPRPLSPLLTTLYRGALAHDLAVLHQHPHLLTTVTDLNSKDANGWTLMHHAAHAGLLDTVKALRLAGIRSDQRDNFGLLPSDYAQFGGHLETENFLRQIEPHHIDLFTAAATNAQRPLERLLAQPDIDINARDTDNRTALHYSAQQGALYATLLLIDRGADLMARDKDNKIPFELAANAGHAAAASHLLEATAGLNVKDNKGWSVLSWAVVSGDQDRVRALLDKGAKVGEGCQNALEVCLLMEDMEMFAIVLAAGGIDAASRRGDTALMGVAKRGNEPLVDILLSYNANPNVADLEHGYTPLRLAAEEGHTPIVLKLLHAGARRDTTDKLGDTALISAARRGQTDAVQALLNSAVDPNITGAGGMTALMWAVYWNEKDTVAALLAGGANVHSVSDTGESALTWAVLRSDAPTLRHILNQLDLTDPTTVKQMQKARYYAQLRGDKAINTALDVHDDANASLLQQTLAIAALRANGARPSSVQTYASDPLLWAVDNDRRNAISSLVAFDHNPIDAANRDTALTAAVKKDLAWLEILLSHGIDPNRVGAGGTPPIIWAARLGHKEAVKTLLAWRADPNADDALGFSAVVWAAAEGYLEIVENLLEYDIDTKHLAKALTLAEKRGWQEIVEVLHTTLTAEEQ